MAGYDSLFLGGTRLTDDCLSELLKGNWARVIIYLDNDNPDVRQCQRDIQRALSLYFPVEIIRESRDPKELTTEELQEVIG
jgi:hypothetical protein